MIKDKVFKSIRTEVLDHQCPNCGSIIKFNPKENNWICQYCEGKYTLQDLENAKNASNIEKNKSLDEDKVDKYNDYFSYYCKDCGAEIITDEQTVATFCVHCGNTAILRNKLSGKFKPDKIIPFKKTKEDAQNAFKALAEKKVLIPKKFTNEENLEKIRGVYVPFWLHDYTVDGDINFNGMTTEEWPNNGAQGYIQQTTVYDVKREGTVEFENIPTDGSTRYEDNLMQELQPYNLTELKTYNHAYLSGFYAERFDEEDIKNEELENNILIDAQSSLLHNFKKYTHVKVKKSNFKIKKHNAKYVLLPVYILKVKYDGIRYYFMMNGQTGEVVGKSPIDRKKTALFSAILFTTIMIILTVILKTSPQHDPYEVNDTAISANEFFLNSIIATVFTTAIMFISISEEIKPMINRKEYKKKKYCKLKNNEEKIVESYITETRL